MRTRSDTAWPSSPSTILQSTRLGPASSTPSPRPWRAASQTTRSLRMVVAGAGNTFVAGADINIFKTLNTREQALERSGNMHARLRDIEDSAKPVVAAIHGNALGGGLELAMSCHYRLATHDAKVGQPEVLLGLIPGAGGTQRLPRLCGAQLALDMCTDGKPISARHAFDAGIVDEVVNGTREALLDAAIAFAAARGADGDVRPTRDQSRQDLERRSRFGGMRPASCAVAEAEAVAGVCAVGRDQRHRGRAHVGLQRRLSRRARAICRLRAVHRVARARASVLRRARREQSARRATSRRRHARLTAPRSSAPGPWAAASR